MPITHHPYHVRERRNLYIESVSIAVLFIHTDNILPLYTVNTPVQIVDAPFYYVFEGDRDHIYLCVPKMTGPVT
jgi:hypothetical protein